MFTSLFLQVQVKFQVFYHMAKSSIMSLLVVMNLLLSAAKTALLTAGVPVATVLPSSEYVRCAPAEYG